MAIWQQHQGRDVKHAPIPVARPLYFTDVSVAPCALQHPHGSERTSDLHVLHATRNMDVAEPNHAGATEGLCIDTYQSS